VFQANDQKNVSTIFICNTVQVFVDYFSEGLRKEYYSKGIIVQVSIILSLIILLMYSRNVTI